MVVIGDEMGWVTMGFTTLPGNYMVYMQLPTNNSSVCPPAGKHATFGWQELAKKLARFQENSGKQLRTIWHSKPATSWSLLLGPNPVKHWPTTWLVVITRPLTWRPKCSLMPPEACRFIIPNAKFDQRPHKLNPPMITGFFLVVGGS
jgi:hypothetical protein